MDLKAANLSRLANVPSNHPQRRVIAYNRYCSYSNFKIAVLWRIAPERYDVFLHYKSWIELELAYPTSNWPRKVTSLKIGGAIATISTWNPRSLITFNQQLQRTISHGVSSP